MKKFGLLGKNINHSFSPLIHNYLYNIDNKKYEYKIYEIDKFKLNDCINLLKNKECNGFNVTIPYKIDIMNYLDYKSNEVLLIGSCNTLKLVNGKIYGYNTDYFGFIDSLKYYNINVFKKDIFIIGNGGSALTVYKVLEELGANIYIIARDKEKALKSFKKVIDIRDYKIIKSGFMLINCTNQGLKNEKLFDDYFYKVFEYCYDLIYLKTPLLSLANKSIDGKYMLISQAIKSYEIWENKELNNKNEIIEKIMEIMI